jgi:hypothetical protein
MNQLQATARRLIAAVAAVGTTLVLFSAVIGLADQQGASPVQLAALTVVR